jgi:hypothetical protein
VSERLRTMTDEELGAALGLLSEDLAWPEAPGLAPSVTRRIAETEPVSLHRRPRLNVPFRRRTVVIVLAALLALATAAAAAKLVIDLGAVTIRVVPSAPSTTPTGAFGPRDLGTPVSLNDAASLAGFRPSVPAALGPPSLAWVMDTPQDFGVGGVRAIVMAWSPRPDLPKVEGTPWGAVLMEFHGEAAVASKVLWGGSGTLKPATVESTQAYFVTGAHELDLLSPEGALERFLVKGNVLLWSDGNITWRLETGHSEADAVRIAESIPS